MEEKTLDSLLRPEEASLSSTASIRWRQEQTAGGEHQPVEGLVEVQGWGGGGNDGWGVWACAQSLMMMIHPKTLEIIFSPVAS